MAESWSALQKMTDDEVIAAHDAAAPSTSVGVVQYRDELRIRAADRAAAASNRVALSALLVSVVSVVIAIVAIAQP